MTDDNAAVLRESGARAHRYIREKVNELLAVMGTAPLRVEELDDATLIDLDPIGIVAASFRQVLEHLHATNEKLRFAGEEIRAIFDSVGVGILVIDRSLRILAYNTLMKELFFPAVGNAVGAPCHAEVCGFTDPARDCPFCNVFADGAVRQRREWRIGERFFDVIGSPVRNPGGEVTSMVLVYADVTERMRAAEALRRSEERYRDLFENAHDLIMSVRLDGSIEFVNRAWCEALGYGCEEAARLTVYDLLHPECAGECRERIAALLREGKGARLHTFLRTKEGEKVVVDGDLGVVMEGGRPAGLRGILRDTTETERLEEEMLKREKLESIGLLAGGIAHDFNNILTGILGNISLAEVRAPAGSELRARLHEAEKAALSARELTQQLLTFARGGLPVRKLAALGELLRSQAAFALRGSGVSCTFAIAPDLRAAEVDEGQIGQVVHNLVLNAVQAMCGGGRLAIAARNVAVAPRDGLQVRPGDCVLITVADEGPGIPPEILPRIFDPYFTTKKDGNGLGLAIVHSIVAKHDGCVRVASEPGRGTTFSLYLPAAASAPPAAAPASAAAAKGSGRILVMDDEAVVREVAEYMLRELGYEVESVPDGAAALRRYREEQEAGRGFDAVIMDLTVPGGIGGAEAIGGLLEIDPGVRAIVSSGYSNNPVMADHRRHGFRGVIAKPYRFSDLAAVVGETLAGNGAPARRALDSGPAVP